MNRPESAPILRALALAVAGSPLLVTWLTPREARVASVVYESWRVPVERTGPDSGVFRGPLRLYRLLDSFERDVLADELSASPNARFSGGTYNTEAERAGGAAFGALPLDVLHFETRGSRLKPPLYLVEVNAEGLPFTHLSLGDHLRHGSIAVLGGSTGLGFNIRPRVADVLRAWSVDPATRKASPVDWRALLAAHATGRTVEAVEALRVFSEGWKTFYALLDAEREAARTDPWERRGKFWSPARKAETAAELARWAAAIKVVRAVLPGASGLATYEHNVISRLPPDLQKAFNAAMRETKPKAPKASVMLNRITDGEIVDTVDLTIDGERWVWRFPTLANGEKPYLDASPLNANAADRARSLKLARKFVDAYDANPASLPGYRYFTVARPYAGRPVGGRVESRSGSGRRKTGAAGTVVYNDVVVFDQKPDDAEAYAAQLMPMAPDGGPMYSDLAAFADATGGMYAFDKRTLRDAAQRAAKSAWTPFTVQGRRFEALYDDAYRGTLSPWLIRGLVNAQNDHGIYRWSARRHDFVSVDAPAQLRVEVQHEPEPEALINDAEIAESMRTQPLSVVKWTDPTSLGPLARKARLARLSQGSGETFISLPANLTPDDLLDVNDGACVFEVKTIKAIGPNRVVTGAESGYGTPKRAVLSIGPKGSTIERWSGVEDAYVKERVTSLRVVGADE